MKLLVWCAVLCLIPGTVIAVDDGTLLFLPSAGKGPGSCPDGVCAQWQTAVWINNASLETATVTVAFLERGADNANPVSATISVPAGATLELPDIMADPLGLDELFGALRFTSNVPVIITGRIADTNVVTNKGTGTAGQFFPALGLTHSIGKHQATTLVGLAQEDTGEHRSNFGFVEVTGHPCQVLVELLSGDGGPALATQTYDIAAHAALQYNISALGGPAGGNQQLRIIGLDGEGRIISFASYLDNNTGDPSTIEAHSGGWDPYWAVGTWVGKAMNVTDPTPETMHNVTMTVDFDPATQTITATYQQGGYVLGVIDPEPVVFVGQIGGDGYTFSGTSETYGNAEFTVSPWGWINGALTEIPDQAFDTVTFTGSLGGGLMSLRMAVNLTTFTEDYYTVVQQQW